VIDDGSAVHYTAVERGTPVFSSDEVELGTVEQVLDGIVVKTAAGDHRFVDAPEVKRTAERAVTLAITATEAENLPPPPENGPSEFEMRRGAGKVARKLGFGWKKRR
jgi:hypothetical protein